MIESEFAKVEPPPIGDLVDNAIRDGRRLRRTRLVQRGVACVAAVGALALGLGMATTGLGSDGPARYAAGESETARPAASASGGDASSTRAASPVPADAPTMAIFEPVPPAPDTGAKLPVAAPATVLMALRTVLPDGPTGGFAGSRFSNYTGVQVYLDRGSGYGMIRVALTRYRETPKCDSRPTGVAVSCRGGTGAWIVETFEIAKNCVQRRGVTVYRTDGLAVQVNVGSCLVDGAWPAPPGVDSVDEEVIGVDEAIDIGLSEVWGQESLDRMSRSAEQEYPSLPMLTAFNGVGS
jgi:hypothetical protein